MRKYKCLQCDAKPMSMKNFIKHKKIIHGVLIGAEARRKQPTHSHGEHDESLPHAHSFSERLSFLSEGAKSLLAELISRKAEIEKELTDLQHHITYLNEKNF